MVLEAACIARAGGTLDEALERIANVRRTHRIYFIPDSLANLVKGGRASKFQGMATSLLNLKIVVTLTETGAIEVLHKAKGMKNAVSYIVDLMAEQSREMGPLVYYKLHTKAYKALEFMDRALDKTDAEFSQYYYYRRPRYYARPRYYVRPRYYYRPRYYARPRYYYRRRYY